MNVCIYIDTKSGRRSTHNQTRSGLKRDEIAWPDRDWVPDPGSHPKQAKGEIFGTSCENRIFEQRELYAIVMSVPFSAADVQTWINDLLLHRKMTLIKLTYVMGALSIPFVLCAFMVGGTSNNGFNVVVTSLMTLTFAGGAYFLLKVRESCEPLQYGFLVGCSTVMTMQVLMSAIFWGQLANCDTQAKEVAQYTCDSPATYSLVSLLASLLFIFQSIFTAACVLWRDDVLDDRGIPQYKPVPASAERSFESGGPPQSADL